MAPKQRDPAKHSKKDPAKPTRAKAARPEMPTLDDSLADLLNPAIGQGTAGLGSQTGLQQPPDNSWDRRADFANAHRARASVARGFGETPQQSYIGKTPVAPGELDPDLAKALGIDEPEDDAAPGVIKYGDEPAHGRLARRRPEAGEPTGVAAFGSTASQQSLDRLLREGRDEFRADNCGRRTGRRGRKNPKAAAPSSSSRTSSRRATSRTAIKELVEGVRRNDRSQVLLGVTGSGKTFTMAKVIEATQRPALILAPNKTLAAQLYGEFRSFFPDNAVEYFVSYYDYYQPEAYIPRTDTYIEKDSSINEQIDRMRHAATRALLERDDVVIVASVSCIYGIGSVETYSAMTFTIKRGERLNQRQLLADLVALQYKRSGGDFYRGCVSRARRRGRDFPGALRGPRLAGVAVRRRGGIDPRIRSAHRAKDRRAGIRQNLRQFALRDAAADAAAGACRASSSNCGSGSISSTPPGGCWKRSGLSSARCTTWK